MRGEQFPKFDPTPMERGILSGLASTLGSDNRYERDDDNYRCSKEYEEFERGLGVGFALRDLLPEGDRW